MHASSHFLSGANRSCSQPESVKNLERFLPMQAQAAGFSGYAGIFRCFLEIRWPLSAQPTYWPVSGLVLIGSPDLLTVLASRCAGLPSRYRLQLYLACLATICFKQL